MSRNGSGSSSGTVWITLAAVAAAVALLAHFDVIRLPWQKTDVQKMLANPQVYSPAAEDIETDPITDVSYVNNIILVFFAPGTSDREMQKAVDSVDGEVVGCLAAIDQLQVKVKTASLEELEEICSTLAERSEVVNATYDAAVVVNTNTVPDDPWGTEAGHHVSWEANNPVDANWWVNATDAMYAWDDAYGLDPIRIGIVDNGFDLDHVDLDTNLRSYTGNNSVELHGTHVAGIIGAEHNNHSGLSGIVPNCELHTADWKLTASQESELRAQGGEWSTTNQILAETVMLIENGSKVVNLSLGASLPEGMRSWSYDGEGRQTSMYLQSLLARGYDFVIVQSAGNGDANDVALDAVYNGLFCSITYDNCVEGDGVSRTDIIDRIIVVGAAALDSNGGYAQPDWSNAGSRVDICAPGERIYSTTPNDEYGYASGTSMAAPIVTGTAALVWEADPSLTGAEVKRIVCENTKDTVKAYYSAAHPFYDEYPMVNTELALQAAMRGSRTAQMNDAAIYAPIIESYRAASDPAAVTNAVYINGSFRFRFQDEGEKPYYALHDIDGNGVQELLIGVYNPWIQEVQIVDLYTRIGETPVWLFDPLSRDYEIYHALDVPEYYLVGNDGTILARVGFNMDIYTYVRTRIGTNGYGLQTLEALYAFYDVGNPSLNYFICRKPCPDPNMDYDDFLFTVSFDQYNDIPGGEQLGNVADYTAWMEQYCGQNGGLVQPSWTAM